MNELVARANAQIEADITLSLQKLAQEFSGKIVFSTSFSYEDQIITHLILKNQIPIRIFTLDTGRLFSETQEIMRDTNYQYDTKIQVYFPNTEAVENLVNQKGNYSFYESVENRMECCNIRKVEPLQRALKDMQCWITGIRSEHSQNRQTMTHTEWDAKNQIVKYHPLLNWTTTEVMEFVKANYIPYNRLHDKGFPSIGCQPCTRAVKEGEDLRAGRWWWEDTSKKECGLHVK